MRWIGILSMAMVASSTASVASAQCLCDDQCPEEALCRDGRCFLASAVADAEAAGGVGAAGRLGGAGVGTATDGVDASVGSAGSVGGNASLDGTVEAGGAVGGQIGEGAETGVEAGAGALGGVSGTIAGDADADADANADADADGDLDGAAEAGGAVGAAGGAGAGITGRADADLSATAPPYDPNAEVDAIGADYTVAIAALIGLGTAFVATAVGALAFGDGIDVSVIPVAGPVIKFAQDIGDGFSVGTALQLTSGIGQVGALTTAILGFVMAAAPDCPGVGEVACGERPLAVTPFVSGGALGLGASGSF